MLSVTTICVILTTSVLGSTREDEFLQQYGPHESVTFEMDHFASDHQLEFDLAGEHYKIELIPSQLHATTSCHYLGRVLEPVQSGTTPSYLSLSLCSNEGIRGHITVPSNHERLVIFPSRFVVDPQYDRQVGTYDLTEPHHVYKEPWSSHPYPTPNTDASRHLLGRYTQNNVEIYVLADAAWKKWFKDQYGSRYSSKLVKYTQDVMNGASAEFEWWNWGNAGKIKLAMVELEIMGDFTGQYATMKPIGNSPSSYCQNVRYDWRQTLAKGCKIDGVKYMRKFASWKKQKGKRGDAYLALSGMDFQKAGWGTTGTICKNGQAGAVVDAKGGPFNDYSLRIKTVAHEIGHNFGMPHYSGVGVMGQPKWRQQPGSILTIKDEYGDPDVRKSGWSSQSVKALNDYFRAQNGLSCLTNGVRQFQLRNNAGLEDDEQDDGSYEVAMDDNLDCLKDNEYADGVCVYNYDNTFVHELTFVKSRDKCLNDKPVFEYLDANTDTSYHLFWNEYEEYVDSVDVSTEWAISMDQVNPTDISATCDEYDLRDCLRSKWRVTAETNDTLEMEQSPTMSVSDGYCAGYAVAMKENDDNASQVTVLYVIIGLLAAVILVGFACFIYQSQTKKKDVSVMIEDESGDEIGNEVEIAVNTNLNDATR